MAPLNFGDEVGLAGIVCTFLIGGLTIIFSNKRWLGFTLIAAAFVFAVWWGVRELSSLSLRTQTSGDNASTSTQSPNPDMNGRKGAVRARSKPSIAGTTQDPSSLDALPPPISGEQTCAGSACAQGPGASSTYNNFAPSLPDPSTPAGARQTLASEGKGFNEEGFFDSIEEGNIEQLKLYLAGGMSPNDLYNRVPLLSIALTNSSPHFAEMVHLFVTWKADPLDFKRVNKRLNMFGPNIAIPTEENALFLQVALGRPFGGKSTDAKEYGEVLMREGARPDGAIQAIEEENRAFQALEAEQVRQGKDLNQLTYGLGSHSLRQKVEENVQVIAFLKSL